MNAPELGRLRSTMELWRLFRAESEEPEPFYRRLASDAVRALERRHGSLRGARIADVGCGPGYYAAAFRDAGATVVAVERDADELAAAGRAPSDALLADATALPIRTGTQDGAFCSNMLEHTPDPARVIDELVRVLRVGGWVYLSFTNWYSPWGGHEMSPYHFLGPTLGPRIYERRHGPEHKHKVGQTLFPIHVGETIRLLRSRGDVVVDRVEPRYWPWANAVMRVPGIREVAGWNCVVRFRRCAAPDPASVVA